MSDEWKNEGDDEDTLFTSEQVKIIGEVHDILNKHFDAYALVTFVTTNDLKQEQARCSHANGQIQAKGLLREGIRILDQ